MDIQTQSALATTSFYKPSEILRIFNEYLARTSVSAKLVCLRGIFLRSAAAQPYGGFFYDKIRDENTADEMAGLRGTINYEVVCDFGLRLEKIYV